MAVDTSIYRNVGAGAQDDPVSQAVGRVGQFVQLGEFTRRAKEAAAEEQGMKLGADAALAAQGTGGALDPAEAQRLLSLNPRALPYAGKFTDIMRQTRAQADIRTLEQMRGLTMNTLDVYRRQIAAGKAEPEAREIANGVYQQRLAGMKLPKSLGSGPLAGQPIEPMEVFDPDQFTVAVDGMDSTLDTMRGVQAEVVQRVDLRTGQVQGTEALTPRQQAAQSKRLGVAYTKQGTDGLKAPEPHTEVGRINQDFERGMITAEQRDAALNKRLSGLEPKARADLIGKVGDDFFAASKNFITVDDNFRNIVALSNDRTGPSQMGMVYSFMKLLDPGSVVRESEFAAAGKAGSLATQVQNYFDKAATGQLIGNNLDEFLDAAGTLHGEQARGQAARAEGLKATQRALGLDDDAMSAVLARVARVEPPARGAKKAPAGVKAEQIPTVNSQAEYDALPKGAQYFDSNGKLATKK